MSFSEVGNRRSTRLAKMHVACAGVHVQTVILRGTCMLLDVAADEALWAPRAHLRFQLNSQPKIPRNAQAFPHTKRQAHVQQALLWRDAGL